MGQKSGRKIKAKTLTSWLTLKWSSGAPIFLSIIVVESIDVQTIEIWKIRLVFSIKIKKKDLIQLNYHSHKFDFLWKRSEVEMGSRNGN